MVAHEEWAESGTLYQRSPFNTSAWSEQSTAGKGCSSAVADNQVIQEPDIDQFKGRFEAFCNALIGLAGLGDPARVIVGQDDGGCIDPQGLLDDFPWVHAGAIDRAAEQFVEAQYPVAVVQVQAAKELVVEMSHARLEEGLGVGRAPDGLATRQGLQVVASREFGQGSQGGKATGAHTVASHYFRGFCVQQGPKTAEALQQMSSRGSADNGSQQFGVAPVPERVVVHGDMLHAPGIC